MRLEALRKPSRVVGGVLALLFITGAAALQVGAQSGPQQADPSGKSSATAEKKKTQTVWTNDNITEFRKPWDQPESKVPPSPPSATQPTEVKPDAASAPAAAASTPPNPSLASSPDELEAQIQAKQEEIRQEQELIDKTSADLEKSDNPIERSALVANLNGANRSLAALQEDLKSLQARLTERKSKTTPKPQS